MTRSKAIKTQPTTTTGDDAVKTILAAFAPFFKSGVHFVSEPALERGDYACLLCTKNVVQGDDVAISYAAGHGRFSHTACLSAHGATISSDGKARLKAQAAAKHKIKAQRAADRAATTPEPVALATAPSTSRPIRVQADEATLRATIEAEYDDLLAQAVERITALQADVDRLQDDNDTLRQQYLELQKIAGANEQAARDERRAFRKAALVSK